MGNVQISLMEKRDTQESAKVLSIAMLNAKLHVAVFQGNSENERQEIEKMFFKLFTHCLALSFWPRKNEILSG
jgi:hypothetical protein